MRYVLFLSIMLVCAQAFAQANLEGVWENLTILHEDWPDRLFGPELGDYTGIPLNDAARFRADAWNAIRTHSNSLQFTPTTSRGARSERSGWMAVRILRTMRSIRPWVSPRANG